MRFLVVPGPDGTVEVIDTVLQTKEAVKMTISQAVSKPVVVPGELRLASFKVGSISEAA